MQGILLSGVLVFLACVAVHIAVWRCCMPKGRIRALCLIFLGLPPALGEVALFSGILSGVALDERFGFYLLSYSLSFAYILSYPAVEAISPTLAISLAIGEAGPGGISVSGLTSIFNDNRLLQPRVKDLLDAGLIKRSDGVLRITPRGVIFLKPFIILRRFVRPGQGRG